MCLIDTAFHSTGAIRNEALPEFTPVGVDLFENTIRMHAETRIFMPDNINVDHVHACIDRDTGTVLSGASTMHGRYPMID